MFEKVMSTSEIQVKVLHDVASQWRLDLDGWVEFVQNSAAEAEAAIPICSWHGIFCDSTETKVISIQLSRCNITSTIPPYLSLLPYLENVDLSENYITGTIPFEVRQMPQLRSLNLAFNEMQGDLGYFSNRLEVLNVSHNNFDVFGLGENEEGLVSVDVSYNKIEGDLPQFIGKMHHLEFMDLSHNQIYGTIPPTIGDLTQLKQMYINNNRLMGTLPLSLTRSHLDIQRLFIHQNDLSGTFPPTMSNLKFLTDLLIDGNKFTGELHGSLCDKNMNHDFFGEDSENGIERDGCNSVACPVNTASIDGKYPCTPCGHEGFTPYLGHTGECYQTNEKIILDTIFQKMNGPSWRENTGWGVDNVGHCDYLGVGCNGSGHVGSLSLKGLGLSGTIPEEIGMLTQLIYLDLSDNYLTGFLPSDLRLPPLQILDVSNNRIKGVIPPMLCLAGDINGNGQNGDFNCDMIACPRGTWSPVGRATPRSLHTKDTDDIEDRHICKPCRGKTSNYIASTSCKGLHILGDSHGDFNENVDANLILSITTLVTSLAVLTICIIVRYRRGMDDENGQMHMIFRDTDNESDTESYDTECTGASSIHLKKLDPEEDSLAKDDATNYSDDSQHRNTFHLTPIGEMQEDSDEDVSRHFHRQQSASSLDSGESKRPNPELWLDVPSV